MDVRAAWPMLLLLLAGCGQAGPGGGGDGAGLGDVTYGPMEVRITPAEAHERVEPTYIAWSDDAFAVLNGDPHAGLFKRTIVAGPHAYSQSFGLAWIRRDYPGNLATPPPGISSRIPLLDLRGLLADPDLVVESRAQPGGLNVTAQGSVSRGGLVIPVRLQAEVRDGSLAWARLESEGTPESPFMYYPSGPLPFEVAKPEPSLPAAEAVRGDATSSASHALLIQLVSDYARNHAGTLPPELTAQELQLELLTSGESWPQNPFDGQPLRDAYLSGHFEWTRCAPDRALFSGYGWDARLVSKGFGAACP